MSMGLLTWKYVMGFSDSWKSTEVYKANMLGFDQEHVDVNHQNNEVWAGIFHTDDVFMMLNGCFMGWTGILKARKASSKKKQWGMSRIPSNG